MDAVKAVRLLEQTRATIVLYQWTLLLTGQLHGPARAVLAYINEVERLRSAEELIKRMVTRCPV